jgi:hypothetical protein
LCPSSGPVSWRATVVIQTAAVDYFTGREYRIAGLIPCQSSGKGWARSQKRRNGVQKKRKNMVPSKA